MGEGYARPPRNRPGSLAILAVIAAIAVGIPAVDRGLPASRTVSAGVPYPVAAGVSVVPPADSTLDLSVTRPGLTNGTASFLLGPVRYLVVVSPFSGTVDAADYGLRDKIISSPGYQITTLDCYFVTNSGLLGRWGRFGAWGWSGMYVVFVAGGLRIEVTASGTDPRLNLEMDGIEASMRTVAYRPPAVTHPRHR
jgi:hypothetical protein